MTQTRPAGSGVDMARAALAAARAAAKNAPAQPQRKKPARSRRDARTGGRDPLGLGAAITGMMSERGWDPPQAGGSVLDQWPTIAPELVGKVHAVRFEHDTGTLHLQPVSPAYATQLRLFRGQILTRIREKSGSRSVRALRILAPSSTPTSPAGSTPEDSELPRLEAPVKTRETASDGYKATRAAALAHRPGRPPLDPYIAAALERQNTVHADTANREQAGVFTDGVAAAERVAEPVVGRSDAVHRAALARKRAEAAGAVSDIPRQVLDVA